MTFCSECDQLKTFRQANHAKWVVLGTIFTVIIAIVIAAEVSGHHHASGSTGAASGSTGAASGSTGSGVNIGEHDKRACTAFWQIHNEATIEAQLNDPAWPILFYQGGAAEDPSLQAEVKRLASDVASYDDQSALSDEQTIASDCSSDGFTS